MTTRRAKLQAALDSNIDAAAVLRQFTADGGSGIDGAVEALYAAAGKSDLTRRAKLQEVLDAIPQEEVAARLRDFTSEGGSGIDDAVNTLYAAV